MSQSLFLRFSENEAATSCSGKNAEENEPQLSSVLHQPLEVLRKAGGTALAGDRRNAQDRSPLDRSHGAGMPEKDGAEQGVGKKSYHHHHIKVFLAG